MSKRQFIVPPRIPNRGWDKEDLCKFYSYFLLYKTPSNQQKTFHFIREDECESCGKKGDLFIHHILPFSDFGLHDVPNLIILCEQCHKKVHWTDFELNRDGVRDDEWYSLYLELMNLSERFEEDDSGMKFKEEVIDKILMVGAMLNTNRDLTRMSPEQYVIKFPRKE